MIFKEIEVKSIEKILAIAIRKKHLVYIWCYKNSSVIKADGIIFRYSLKNKELVIQPQEGSRYYLENMITGEGRMNIFIPDQSIYFSSDLKCLEEDLVLIWPDKILVHERRNKERFDLNDMQIGCEMKINGKIIKKNCFDFSSGGLSFIISKSEKSIYEDGQVIEDIKLMFCNEVLKLHGRVVSIDAVDPFVDARYSYIGFKVSVRFLDPDQSSVEKMKKIVKNITGYAHSKNF